MTWSRRKVIGLIGASVAISPAHATAAPLLCVGGDQLPPLSEKRADGTVWGIRVDVVNLLSKLTGLPVRHDAFPWSRAQAMVETGEADLFCAALTDRRRDYALFSHRCVIPADTAAYYLKSSPKAEVIAKAKSPDDLRDMDVVSYLGNGGVQTLFPNKTIRMLPTSDLAFRAVIAGRADICVEAKIFAPWVIRAEGISNKLGAVDIQSDNAFDLYLGLRRTYPDAQAMMNKFNRAIETAWRNGEIRKILASYDA